MEQHILTKDDGWVEVASGTTCRLQVVSQWTTSGQHPGILRIHVGTSIPTTTINFTGGYFDLAHGDHWRKTAATGNVYVYAPYATKESPCVLGVSPDVEGVASGGTSGGGGSGDASATNQVTAISKLTELSGKLTALVNEIALLNADNATEATALAILGKLGTTLTTLAPTTGYSTVYSRITASGTTPTGAERVSIMNSGTANGTVQGTILKPGESLTYEAPQNAVITTIPYDATGTEFMVAALMFDAIIT